MKARTLVFTLLIGLMCFAGFGSTTSDLTDNSTNQTNVDDHDAVLVNVVMVISQEVTHMDTAIELEVSASDVFEIQDANQIKSMTATLEKLPVPPDWCDSFTELNRQKNLLKVTNPHDINCPNALIRNPRDGLNFFHV